MDFFEAQDRAKQKTKTLVLFFILAVLATGVAIYFVITFALFQLGGETAPPEFWDWRRMGWTVGGTAAVMAGCSLYKISALQAGGSAVAEMLGGRRVHTETDDLKLQRLRNVVEEMALASGARIPEVYVLEGESSINAFAAGYTLDNAAVAVSRGALDQLDREELQGVVAHEFSHILNGDMRINTRLIGIIFGVLVIAVIGRIVLQGFGRAALYGGGARRSRRGARGGGGGAVFVLFAAAFAIMIIGYIGVFFGRLIQSAISRQREYLADAAAVQFTRNPSGIANALRRIQAAAEGSRIRHPDAQETSHMFFANALKRSLGGAFATHPPLDKRIAAIDPQGIHAKSVAPAPAEPPPPAKPEARRPRDAFLGTIGGQPMLGAILAGAALERLPESLRREAHQPQQAWKILNACIDPADTSLAGRPLASRERFGLLELALAALKQLPDETISRGLAELENKAKADDRITFQEQCLLIAVRRNLSDWKRNADSRLLLLPDAQPQFEIILSAIALLDHPGEAEANTAFESAQAAFSGFGSRLRPSWEAAKDRDAVNAALEKASRSIFAARKALIDAAARIASSDDSLSEREQTRIRSLCLALACPLPQ